jgi:hypothetical protein
VPNPMVTPAGVEREIRMRRLHGFDEARERSIVFLGAEGDAPQACGPRGGVRFLCLSRFCWIIRIRARSQESMDGRRKRTAAPRGRFEQMYLVSVLVAADVRAVCRRWGHTSRSSAGQRGFAPGCAPEWRRAGAHTWSGVEDWVETVHGHGRNQ